MTATHGQIARMIVEKQPLVFARACRDVVASNDYTMLNRILPGVAFSTIKTGPDRWELMGVCDDGSQATWTLGG